jgi:hypothetical protein
LRARMPSRSVTRPMMLPQQGRRIFRPSAFCAAALPRAHFEKPGVLKYIPGRPRCSLALQAPGLRNRRWAEKRRLPDGVLLECRDTKMPLLPVCPCVRLVMPTSTELGSAGMPSTTVDRWSAQRGFVAHPCAAPTVSAIRAPRAPIGFDSPVVVSCAV